MRSVIFTAFVIAALYFLWVGYYPLVDYIGHVLDERRDRPVLPPRPDQRD